MKNGTMASGLTTASSVTSGLMKSTPLFFRRLHARHLLGRGRFAAAEHAVAFHLHHHVAVLVEHFPARAHEAGVRALAQRARLHDAVPERERVAGVHGLEPAQV